MATAVFSALVTKVATMSEPRSTTIVFELGIAKAAEEYDDQQDCTCADPDDGGTCWYYLTDDERMSQRVRYVAGRLEIDQAVVWTVLQRRWLG